MADRTTVGGSHRQSFQILKWAPGLVWSGDKRRVFSEDPERDLIVREGIGQLHQGFSGGGRIWLVEGWKFPEAFPARADALLEEKFVIVDDPGAVLLEGNGRLAGPFDREAFGVVRGGGAEGEYRAEKALRGADAADRRAEFHQGGVIEASVFRGKQLLGGSPESALAGGGVDGNTQMRNAGQDTGNVGVHDGGGEIVGERVDGAGGVAAHAWERGNFFQFARELATVLGQDKLGSPVEIAGAGVVPEAFPEAKDFFLRGVSKGADGGKTFQPAAVVIQDGDNLRLLQHELADHHRVRVAGMPPGKVASVLGEPIRQRGLEGAPVFWFFKS